MNRYWQVDDRQGPTPELPAIGPWYGPVRSIIDAPVIITEDDLEYATHPIVATYQSVFGSIARLESSQNLEYLLQNQPQPTVDAQPTGQRHPGIRPSAAQPMSLQLDHQVNHAEVTAPYRVGALVARETEGSVPANNSQSMWPLQSDMLEEPPYLA